MSFTVGVSHGKCDTGSCPCKNLQLASTIWTAAEHGNFEVVVLKVTKQPKVVDKLDAYGYSALHYAAQQNHVEIVKFLLVHGASPDYNCCGATPLHRAAFAGSIECCKLLVAAGADVNAQDFSFGDLNTPVHKAALQQFNELVAYFSSVECFDPSVVNNMNQTVSDILNASTCVQTANNLVSEPDEPVSDSVIIPVTNDTLVPESVCELCLKPSLSFTRNSSNKLICFACRYRR